MRSGGDACTFTFGTRDARLERRRRRWRCGGRGVGCPERAVVANRAYDRFAVEVEDIVRALRSYGVLTRERLCRIVGADEWPDHNFTMALRKSVSDGRVTRLGDS